MIRLDATNRKLQAVLAGAITTNQLPCTVSYSDKTSTDYVGATQLTNTNSTTAVDICAAPGASTVRDIDYLSIRNRDTVAATVTVMLDDNGTDYEIVKAALAVGDQLIYTHGDGWRVVDADGNLKTGGSSGTGDVVGPASATANSLARFDGTTGKLLKDGAVIGADVASLAANTFTGLQQLDSFTIASGATVDLGTSTGNTVTVTHSTGTTATTSLGGATLKSGTEITTIYSISGGTLSLTHHATNLILAGGANITLANGDALQWRKMHDTNAEWKMVGGVKADGTAWVVAASGITLDSPITMATGSPTIISISTSISAGTKRIDIGVAGGSSNSTSNWLIQLGDSGGFETTGYSSGATNDNGTRVTSTAGFIVTNAEAAALSWSGVITLLLIDSANNTWVASGHLTDVGSGADAESGGHKSLSGELTSLRLTTVGGTATFDAGTLAIQYS